MEGWTISCLFSFPIFLSYSLSPSLYSIFLLSSSILYLNVQPAQFNNELSLLSFSFPCLPASLITPPNSSSHSFSILELYFMNGPRLYSLLLIFVHSGTQSNSAFIILVLPPLHSTRSAPSFLYFLLITGQFCQACRDALILLICLF